MNPSPLLEDVKKAIIDFRNREYGEENDFEMLDVLYPDLRHVGLAYIETPSGQHRIQYELDLEEKTWTQYVDDVAVVTESFARESEEQIDPLRVMKDEIELSDFSDLVYIEEDQLQQAIRKAAQADAVYDSLDKDMDNDGVADRFDYAFQDSDALESTYDVDEHIKEPESGHSGPRSARSRKKARHRNDEHAVRPSGRTVFFVPLKGVDETYK